MTLHDLFTLFNLPIGTLGHDMTQLNYKYFDRNIGVQYIRYTSEYIPKLQLHQNFLLTRKVFSTHNSSSLLLWINIKSRSSDHGINIKS